MDTKVFMKWMMGFVRRWIWPVVFVCLAILALLLIRPFATANDMTGKDVAAAWNEGIARLGILPVYPPGEDFYVGDVWAVIAGANVPGTNESKSAGQTTLLGKSVRIANIDLRKEMQAAKNQQPKFSDTTSGYKGDGQFNSESLAEMSDVSQDDRVALTLTAFPGIEIKHKVRVAASFGLGLGALGLGGQDQELEQIRIPIAETYGAPVGSAFIRFDEWCTDPKTRIFCTDEYARRIMAYSVNEGVLETANGKYNTKIALEFVYRVFMTREIDRNNLVGGGGGANLQVNAKQGAEIPPSSSDVPAPVPSVQPVDPMAPASNAGLAAANSREVAIHEVFQRPLVFGYRAIRVGLIPSTPGKASP